MLYRIAHILRDKMPWIWDLIGILNSWLFGLRYGKKLHGVEDILARYSNEYTLQTVDAGNVAALAEFFAEQPAEAFEYFHPHAFDEKSLKHLAMDKSFLMYVVMKGQTVVGYIFQRSFFWGKSFRGYMTHCNWRRKGINKLMNLCANDVSEHLGLKVFGSIAPGNVASMKSAESACEIKIIEQLADGDYYVQYLPKKQ